MFTFFGGGASVQWYADFEWDGSQDVTSNQLLDFRDIAGWSENQNVGAPLAAGNNQVALSSGLYLCEVFAQYDAQPLSSLVVLLSGDHGSFSKAVITVPDTTAGGFLSSGLFTIFINNHSLLSMSVHVTGANTVTIDFLQLRISKLV